MREIEEIEKLIITFFLAKKNFFDDDSVLAVDILNIIKKISFKMLIDTDVTEYEFVNISVAQRICEQLRIISIELNKFKQLKEYDERQEQLITHVIYSTLIVQDYIESLISLFLTKLDQQNIILEKSWMRRHEVSYNEHINDIFF